MIPDDIAAAEMRDEILDALDDDQRVIAIMLEQGHTHREIAIVFGVSRQAISQRVAVIRRRVSKVIDNNLAK